MTNTHTFHIPVMGIGFTLDTPLMVSQYGIDSVVSLVDDILIEKIRKMYCGKYGVLYEEISNKSTDYRAERITSYLNLMNDLAKKKIEELKNVTLEKRDELVKHFSMMPDSSAIKQEFKSLTDKFFNVAEIGKWLKDNLSMGSIDVNIMTKLDRQNYVKDEKLPNEYNDAHAALRGYANSDLCSSLILSAGMNPRLYTYLESFEDFRPDANGDIKKKIVLKVSDYRSALIQGKFLAKKGLWVSEYRIESGLNCGGHAFATDGYLMGPILEEFREKRQELAESVHAVLVQSLTRKECPIPEAILPMKFSAQGGVGTSDEHELLLDHYGVDSVGWGTPFLLVPEATTVDPETRGRLIEAKEKDLYLSNISPLGVPFNSLRTNTKDIDKLIKVSEGRPGSSCPKKYVSLNTEFTDKPICVASRQYQHLKLKSLEESNLTSEEFERETAKVVEKSCICVGLGTSSLLANDLNTRVEGAGVSICPGPNLAYFSKEMSLTEITDHIYGRGNVISRDDRPNMFIKELGIYIDYLKDKVADTKASMDAKQKKYLSGFSENLMQGVDYYRSLFDGMKDLFVEKKTKILADLDSGEKAIQVLGTEIEDLPLAEG